ncbi:DNA/RNA non-specific endonuclease [Moraxella macacae]|nr:DNA/RNA non-specific endonuclease [Moraxella macacae]
MVFINVSAAATADTTQQDNHYYQQKHLNECPAHYYQNQNPQIINNKPLEIYYLCFSGFAIGYSADAKIALWSAEHLTADRIEQAGLLERKDNFHAEQRLPIHIQATLHDYKKQPYDRGHLSPNGDMATTEQQYDSFSLANIVPQNPDNNRKTWRSIESRTRYLTLKYNEAYVVTGPAFIGKNVKKINQKILVPTHLYKAIYIPSLNQAGVYFAPNDDSQYLEVISLEELALRTGIHAMPSVPINVQQIAMPLPTDGLDANLNNPAKNQTNVEDYEIFGFFINLLLEAFKWLISLPKS